MSNDKFCTPGLSCCRGKNDVGAAVAAVVPAANGVVTTDDAPVVVAAAVAVEEVVVAVGCGSCWPLAATI